MKIRHKKHGGIREVEVTHILDMRLTGWQWVQRGEIENGVATYFHELDWEPVPEEKWVLAEDMRVRFVSGEQVYRVERKVKG